MLSCPAMPLESYDVRLSVPTSVSSTSLLTPIDGLPPQEPLDAKPWYLVEEPSDLSSAFLADELGTWHVISIHSALGMMCSCDYVRILASDSN